MGAKAQQLKPEAYGPYACADGWTLLGVPLLGEPRWFTARVAGRPASHQLQHRMEWRRVGEGWLRADVLTNVTSSALTVTQASAHCPLPVGEYEADSQGARWVHENQPSTHHLLGGDLVLEGYGGRSCERSTPSVWLRNQVCGFSIGAHLLPVGDWRLRVRRAPEMGTEPRHELEWGYPEIAWVLQPGESLPLPELFLLPGGDPQRSMPELHRAVHELLGPDAHPPTPIPYNTWFDRWSHLDADRLRAQLAAAKEIGCEAFVVDAGWYGQDPANWYEQAGDWTESPGNGFGGDLRAFADEVRAAGLGFGLWMETERFAQCPVRQEHPTWFVPETGGYARMDLTNPSAREWLYREVLRLVDQYGLAWMKVDFNFGYAEDPAGRAHHDYVKAFYALIDQVRAERPHVTFEGCASGGLRHDLEALRHFAFHFPSDTCDPVDQIRLCETGAARWPYGRCGRWVVLYPGAQDGRPLSPAGASERHEEVDARSAALAALPGLLGVSGDLAGLRPEDRAALAEVVGLAKRNRVLLRRGCAMNLTPAQPMTVRHGLAATQVVDPAGGGVLVIAHWLGMGALRTAIELCLPPGRSYRASGPEGSWTWRSGTPLRLSFEARGRSTWVELTPDEPAERMG